jgi:hypothetical protein
MNRRALLLAELRAHDTRPASNRAAWQRRQALATTRQTQGESA